MNELVTSETNDLGLSIDILDVDRLREWARLLLLHGDEINHWCWWGSVPSVASKMQIMATEMEKAIRDIGMLRRAGIITEAKVAAEGAISSPASQSRYFVNINGFGDGTRYVRADTDGRCFGMSNTGVEWDYSSQRLSDFVEKVERGIWREMTESEALAEVSSPATPQLIAALSEIEQHCPCGARPESLNTHPHVGGCPVERALRFARALEGAASPATPRELPDGPVGDLLAFGQEEAASALTRKDRDDYQFWQGWNSALERVGKGAASPATPRQAKLQRYERDVVNHQGGHYGEEQWTTVEMVPCETGAWVKYRDIEGAASPATPADLVERRLKLSEECRQNLFDALQKALAVAQSQPPAPPALKELIVKWREQAA